MSQLRETQRRRRRAPTAVLLLVLLVTWTHVAAAQAPPDTVVLADTTVSLDEVTVTAARSATLLAESPVRVTVLGSEAIAATGARHVADLLQATSGAFVKRYGSGGLASISLRGTGASQTLVLLDGHRIADPQLGQLDLSLLPTLLLQSVEVMPGAGSALYGTDALGGVVNLRTRRPEGQTTGAVSAGYGAYGDRTASALVSGGSGPWSALVLGEYATSEGDYPYFDASRFPADWVRRTGADRTRRSVYASARYHREARRLRATAWYTDAERGLPTIGGSQARGERQEDAQLRLWLDGETRLGGTLLRTGGLVQHSSLRYFTVDEDGDVGADDTGRTLTASGEFELQRIIGRRWLVSTGTTLGYGQARHPSLADDARELHGGVFASAQGSYGVLQLFPALHADGYLLTDGTTRLALAPRLGLNLQPLSAVEALRLKASAGRAFRVPTFNDRFWQPGGNPELQPERGWTADAGVVVTLPRHRAEVTYFTSRVHDQIVWVPGSGGYWTPRNLQHAATHGVEASLEQTLPLGRYVRLRNGVFYTLTHARDRSDLDTRSYDEPLRYVPPVQVKGHVGVDVGPAALDVYARHVGRRYVTSDGQQSLDPYSLVEVRLRLRATWSGMEGIIALSVDNVLDAEYQVVEAEPMPPRHARLQLTLHLP